MLTHVLTHLMTIYQTIHVNSLPNLFVEVFAVLSLTKPSLFLVVPGAPLSVTVVSSTYDSVKVRLVLSSIGTAPLTRVEAEFHAPSEEEGRRVNTTLWQVDPGDTVTITLSDLQDNTLYSLSFAVYNYGGRGMPSQQIEITTGEFAKR